MKCSHILACWPSLLHGICYIMWHFNLSCCIVFASFWYFRPSCYMVFATFWYLNLSRCMAFDACSYFKLPFCMRLLHVGCDCSGCCNCSDCVPAPKNNNYACSVCWKLEGDICVALWHLIVSCCWLVLLKTWEYMVRCTKQKRAGDYRSCQINK